MKTTIITGISAVLLAAAVTANAIPSFPSSYFVLDASDATSGSEPNPFWYKDNAGGVEEGDATAKAILDTAYYGSGSDGYWAVITWGTNPQPTVTQAFLKAGSREIYWGPAALSAFNSGTYEALVLVQDSIKNSGNGSFNAISHVTLNGEPGTDVPDAGTTITLLGLGMLGLRALRRKIG